MFFCDFDWDEFFVFVMCDFFCYIGEFFDIFFLGVKDIYIGFYDGLKLFVVEIYEFIVR